MNAMIPTVLRGVRAGVWAVDSMGSLWRLGWRCVVGGSSWRVAGGIWHDGWHCIRRFCRVLGVVALQVAITVRTPGEVPRDVVLDVDDEARAADIAVAVGAPAGTPVFVDGRLLDAEVELRSSPVKDGAVVDVGGSGGGAGQRRTAMSLSVTGGYGAGQSWPIDVGVTHVGSAPGGAVTDERVRQQAANEAIVPWLPPIAFTVETAFGGSVGVTPHVAGVELDGEPLVERSQVRPGQAITVQGSVLEVTPALTRPLATTPSGDGSGWDIYRPPRLLPAEDEKKFTYPKQPKKPRARGFPIIMMFMPILVAAGMVYFMKSWNYAMFALFSPLMLIGSWLTTKFGDKKNYKAELEECEATTVRIRRSVDDAVLAEQRSRRLMAPNAAELLARAQGPGYSLWERRVSDPDFLELRVGLASLVSSVKVQDPNADQHLQEQFPLVRSVPLTVDVSGSGVLGVCGYPSYVRSMVMSMVGQVAALHSPREVGVYVISAPDRALSWQWARWLPHVRAGLGQETFATMAVDAQSAARRVGELNAVIGQRQAAVSENKNAPVTPNLVVVLDGYRSLRGLPGVLSVLKDGPAVGVYVLCVDDDERYLPEEASSVVTLTDRGTVNVARQRVPVITEAMADVVLDEWAESLARGMSALRDAGEEDGAALPSSCRLVELIGLEDFSSHRLLTEWATGGRRTSVVIGEGLDGPFSIDIVGDGPHALVAGTTGSGKSELLQSWVASLAAANRSDEMCFVLVDYKGGAAFGECEKLPHTVGMVTDLDAHLVERSLASLRAELKYREEAFAEVGAANITEYQAHFDRGNVEEPLPRLIVMIDEFAALKQEFPDFMDGLIDFAARGRSLGMHLVLATQRPAGVITGPIRANTNLRLSLRVTDAGESNDVIDAPDAGAISPGTPGRGFARLGPAAPVAFQTARVAGTAKGVGTVVEPWLAPLPLAAACGPTPRRPRKEKKDALAVTDLAKLVDAINAANGGLGIPPLRKPWLPPLPEVLTAQEVGRSPWSPDGPGVAAWGRIDLPHRQLQIPAVVDLADFTHMFVVGAARSGRTQVLRTIASSLAVAYSVGDVHVHGIDCGNGGLAALESLPHCGTVAARHSPQRIRSLVKRLHDEMVSRGRVLSSAGVGSLTELRERLPHGDPSRLPHIVVLLDRWEGWMSGFSTMEGGALHELLMGLLSDGPSVGVHLVMTGDRTLSTGKMMSLTEQRLTLRLNEKSDYGMVGLPSKSVPEEMAPGRMLHLSEGYELQVALVGEGLNAADQAAHIGALGLELEARVEGVPAELMPLVVRELPTNLSVEQLVGMSAQQGERGALQPVCGVGGANVDVLGPDLAKKGCFVVAGPPQSGRSAVLYAMAHSVMAFGGSVVVVAPRDSVLRDLPGVSAVFTSSSVAQEELGAAMGEVPGRVLVIDDAVDLKEAPCKGWLEGLASGATERSQGMIIAGEAGEISAAMGGWLTATRRARCGVLTSVGSSFDGEAVGARLGRAAVDNGVTPGQGWYSDGSGDVQALVYPKPPEA